MVVWKSACRLLLCVALLISIFGAMAVAQDPTKAERTHYKLAFENE